MIIAHFIVSSSYIINYFSKTLFNLYPKIEYQWPDSWVHCIISFVQDSEQI